MIPSGTLVQQVLILLRCFRLLECKRLGLVDRVQLSLLAGLLHRLALHLLEFLGGGLAYQ